MAKGHVEEGWQGYRLVVLPRSASEVQVSETRKGFYAGAWFLLTHLVRVLDPGDEPTEEDLAIMEDIATELRAFAESGGEARGKGHG
jgi:hypothetical protein